MDVRFVVLVNELFCVFGRQIGEKDPWLCTDHAEGEPNSVYLLSPTDVVVESTNDPIIIILH